MEKLKMHSPDLTAQNIDRIAELFPTVVTETVDAEGTVSRAVDFDLLRQELSDHIVEGPQERYQLDWPGKRDALFAANAPVAKTLRPVRGESVDFDTTQNLFIEGDNLEALKLLQESYLGKVKLIYIDPPYNTGNDFVYNDDFAESNAEFLARSNQVDDEGNGLVANPESNGRFHSDWLSMMFPRLKLARNLLADDGVLFISIDDVELAALRLVVNQVFGSQNFVGTLIHQRAKGGGNARHLVRGHDYILVVSRDIGLVHPLRRDKVVQGKVKIIDGVPTLIDDDVLRKTFGKYEAGTERRCLYEEIVEYKGEDKKKEIDAAVESGQLFLMPWPGGHIVAKRTPIQEASSKLYSIIKVLSELGARDLDSLQMTGLFPYPKPVELMIQLIRAGTMGTGTEIVLDLFAGSGSTAHGVLNLNATDGGNRRFIMVQLPETCEPNSLAAQAGYDTIADIAKERIHRAGKQVLEGEVLEGWNKDVGFRVLKIDTSNMNDVLRTPDQVDQGALNLYTDSVKPDRTGEDLLFQVLLDWGLELTMPVEVEEIDGHEVFVVEVDALIACFAEGVSAKVVKAIANRQPMRAVFRDSGFATDADRINAEQIFAERSPATDVKTI